MALPTYSLIKVKDVKDNVLILENGSLRSILQVSGINFSLLASEEQDMVINQFKAFLDGLDFPVEILVYSRLENLNNYLKVLHLRLEEETEPLIKLQLEQYISFLEDYLQNHKIMKKIFYIVVPYDTVVLVGGKQEQKQETWETQLLQLETRVNYVEQSLSGIGLTVKRLTNQEILELLFEVYNPNLRWAQIPKQVIEKLTEQQ